MRIDFKMDYIPRFIQSTIVDIHETRWLAQRTPNIDQLFAIHKATRYVCFDETMILRVLRP